MKKNKSSWSSFPTLALISASALMLTSCGPGSDKTASVDPAHDTVRFGYVAALAKAPVGPMGWALQKNLLQPALAKIGINHVVLYPANIGPDLNEAFAAGSIDVATTGDVPGLIGKSAGLPIRLINLDITGINLAIVVRQDGPKSVDELVGRKVSTTPGTIVSHYLDGVLTEKGIAGKVTTVNLTSSAVEPALLSGEIDAGVVTAPALYIQRGFRVIDQASDHENLTGNSITVASESFLQAHPDFVTVWNQVRAQAVADLQAHPDDFYRYFAANSSYPAALLPQLYPLQLFNPDPLPTLGVAALENAKTYLLNGHLIQQDFSIADWSVLPIPPPVSTAQNGETK